MSRHQKGVATREPGNYYNPCTETDQQILQTYIPKPDRTQRTAFYASHIEENRKGENPPDDLVADEVTYSSEFVLPLRQRQARDRQNKQKSNYRWHGSPVCCEHLLRLSCRHNCVEGLQPRGNRTIHTQAVLRCTQIK